MSRNIEKKRLFAQGRALGRSNKDLANELNISEKTASVWNRDPVVQAKIHDLQVENWVQSQGLLIRLQREAIESVAYLMIESKDDRIRLQAATLLLNLCSSFGDYI